MKNLILTLVATLFVTAGMAQTTATKSTTSTKKTRANQTEMVTKRTQEMVQKYGLSTEQATKLKTLNEKYMGQACNGQCPEKTLKANAKKLDATATTATSTTTTSTASLKKVKGTTSTKSAKSSTSAKSAKQGGPDMTAYNKELKSIMSDSQYQAYEKDMAAMKTKKSTKSTTKTSSKTTK